MRIYKGQYLLFPFSIDRREPEEEDVAIDILITCDVEVIFADYINQAYERMLRNTALSWILLL